MFDVGFGELLVFAMVALVVLGPEKLPQSARIAGAWIRRIRSLLTDVQSDIRRELANSDLDSLKQLRSSASELDSWISSAQNSIHATISVPTAHGTTQIKPRDRLAHFYFLLAYEEQMRLCPPAPFIAPRPAHSVMTPTLDECSSENNSLTHHLIELRSRLIHVLISLSVIFVSLLFFANELYDLLAAPLMRQLPPHLSLIATDITASFMAPVTLCFYLALLIGMPYVLYHVWSFISPGLYQHEKRLAFPVLILSVVMFYSGVLFAYAITLPAILKFFIVIAPSSVATMADIRSYLDFCIHLFVIFGLVFEIPILTFILVVSGVISRQSLINKRRYIIVGCFFISMFITPPDALSMAMLAIPMWLLFEIGLLASKFLVTKSNHHLTAQSDSLDTP